jgi:putative flippase GtrA
MLRLRIHLRRFVIYCVVGACAFSADYSLFLALLHRQTNLYVANVAGICAGIIVSFTLNRKYNFRRTDAVAVRATRFVVVAATGMGLSSLSIMLLVGAGLDPRFAKIVSMAAVFAFQFLANSLWTFGFERRTLPQRTYRGLDRGSCGADRPTSGVPGQGDRQDGADAADVKSRYASGRCLL